MTKSELRKKYKTLRSHLSGSDLKIMSLQITAQLRTLAIWDKKYYHVYLPIKKFKEIETHDLIEELQKNSKKVVVSKSDFESVTMTHFMYLANTPIVENEFGIPEPASGIQVFADKIEVVFVPLLSFDISGNRVGYGKGFYDRFLMQCNASTIKIGLSVFEAEPTIEGVFENDIKLDLCVTPTKVYTF